DEPPAGNEAVPEDWPSSGDLEFRNVSMRYLPWTDLALKNMSFTIRSQEKIGVVGKEPDSCFRALCHLFKPCSARSDGVRQELIDYGAISIVQPGIRGCVHRQRGHQ